MKKFDEWLTNLNAKEVTWLAAIFLAAMMGTLFSGLVLQIGMESFGGESVLINLLISLLATAVYAAVVLIVFSVIFPETIPALKKIFLRNQNK